MKKIKEHILAVFYGLVFGIANIIPGVSGGTMLVVCGCFDKVCGALSLNLKEIKKNIVFLVFFAIGTVVGILGFAFVIDYLFKNFNIPANTFFMGLMVGSVPLIYKNATKAKKLNWKAIFPFIIALVGVVIFTIASQNFDESIVAANPVNNYLILFIAGILGAVAMIIPGVSGSFVMMLFGVYPTIIAALKALVPIKAAEAGDGVVGDVFVLIPTGLGIIIGLVFGARLISFLLKKFPQVVYSAILGLVFGSLYAILPQGVGINLETAIGAVTFVAGAALAVLVGKLEKEE